MKYFVADTVENKIFERDIDPKRIEGFPLCLQAAIVQVIDDYYEETALDFREPPESQTYEEVAGTAIFKTNPDRDHWYALIFNPLHEEHASQQAQNILAGWQKED